MAIETNNNTEESKSNERLIDAWGWRKPRFEKKYEQSVLRVLSTYGIKAGETTEEKGKILGAAYEPLILAFFIGLYANKKMPLPEDPEEVKDLGHPLMYWGNNTNKQRKAYPRLREYIFDALVARTDIDWIALDKGKVKAGEVVSKLMTTMEEYTNYGLSVMEEKLKADKSYFYSQRAFLDLFMQLTENRYGHGDQDNSFEDDVVAEPL